MTKKDSTETKPNHKKGLKPVHILPTVFFHL